MNHPWWAWPIGPELGHKEAAPPLPRSHGEPSAPYQGRAYRRAQKALRRRERRAGAMSLRFTVLSVARIVFVSSGE